VPAGAACCAPTIHTLLWRDNISIGELKDNLLGRLDQLQQSRRIEDQFSTAEGIQRKPHCLKLCSLFVAGYDAIEIVHSWGYVFSLIGLHDFVHALPPVDENALYRTDIIESINFGADFLIDLPNYSGATCFPKFDLAPDWSLEGLTFDFVMPFENKEMSVNSKDTDGDWADVLFGRVIRSCIQNDTYSVLDIASGRGRGVLRPYG